MSPNYEYVLQLATRSTTVPAPRVLDYGCGMKAAGNKAALIEIGLARGLDIYGVDAAVGEVTDRVKALTDNGGIPFEDHTFDVVVSNQVFEHIAHPAPVFHEIARVLKPGGVFIALFPDKTVWFEGHLGLYFVHWLMPWPRAAYYYLVACHAIGLGHWRGTDGSAAWARTMIEYFRAHVFYASAADVRRWWIDAFGTEPAHLERDWMLFRIAQSNRWRWLLPVARLRLMAPALVTISRVRSGVVLRSATRPDSAAGAG